jgi:hypothetical protein
MFDWIRQQVLRFLRVPHDPAPPFGAPGSVRVFRAGKNYYNLRLARWGLGQGGAVVGLGISLVFFGWFKGEVETGARTREQAETAALAAKANPAPAATPTPSAPPALAPGKATGADSTKPDSARKSPRGKRDPRRDFQRIAARTPTWVIPVIAAFEVWGILLFLVQLPVTFAAVRLDFEMHWYIVTDRSLRIRTGLVSLQETTMSFANLQQVEVKQGPLQRLLGLADVHVQSAGGGGEHQPGQQGDSLHTGIFHSVNNATEIRDLILERLRQFRQAGLGDPDDHHAAEPVVTAGASDSDTLAAARELLTEARALRQSLS